MPRPFEKLSVPQFATRLASHAFERRIGEVHLHHTWRPDHALWRAHHARGRDTGVIEGMWRYHTEVQGWSDIAQHVSIAPDGAIWTGRSWNRAPASASGHNGNADVIPFMIEMIGDFDAGRDELVDPQRDAVLEVIALVQLAFGLAPEALRLHNAMSAKSCPGDGPTVRWPDLVQAVREKHAAYAARDEVVQATHVAPRHTRDARADDAPTAELDVRAMTQAEVYRYFGEPRGTEGDGERTASWRGGASRGESIPPDVLEELRPHVINLTDGRLSTSGGYRTSPGDVRAIFAEHLPRWVRSATSAEEPLRIVLWAHGGLVSERAGLEIARAHVRWWQENGVYPLYFVWETGLLDALRSILESVTARLPGVGRRGLIDKVTDPLVEEGARAFGGGKIWSAMKDDARAASARGGGAAEVARQLAAFLGSPAAPKVELHAVGHSAGSIFHSHFIPTASREGVPDFHTLQLLAPAIRADEFRARLVPLLGAAAGRMTMYTMRRSYEEADDCKTLYRKSLLYLIHHALEPRRRTPILGLERSLTSDPVLLALFTGDAPSAELVWSVGPESASETHGGFDDDPATMNSVARRVLGRAPAVPYRAARALGATEWEPSTDWIAGFDVAALASRPPAVVGDGSAHDGQPAGGARVRPRRARALCIGIDQYPEPGDRLHGCVNDAMAWQRVLEARGFGVRALHDADATHGEILDAVAELVRGARAGDIIVFQYAGHGTRVPDYDGDERDRMDEAYVPIDYGDGAFLVDDDLRTVFAELREGVNLTCFVDCCHSATITRILARRADARPSGRARFLTPAAAALAAHERFRASLARRPSGERARDGSAILRWVTFSACQATEEALEFDGQGDFTRHALAILDARDADALSHAAFQRRLVDAFGPDRRQTPHLDCPRGWEELPLLAALDRTGAPALAATGGNGTGNGQPAGRVRQIAEDLLDVAARLPG